MQIQQFISYYIVKDVVTHVSDISVCVTNKCKGSRQQQFVRYYTVKGVVTPLVTYLSVLLNFSKLYSSAKARVQAIPLTGRGISYTSHQVFSIL